MKKIISLILTVAMLFSMTTLVAPVSAETEVNDLFMAEPTREEFLNAPAVEYLDIPYTNDAFVTVEDVYKYYPRDNTATNFPTTDVDGLPISNYVKEDYSKANIGTFVFLIDSILGNAEGKYSGYYLNATDAKTAHSYTFKINGNPKFRLQSTDVDGTMHFLYNHNGINFKMGPIGGNGAHYTSTGGYNVHVLPNAVPVYPSTGSIEKPTAVNILMTTWTANGGGYAGLFPVQITYEDGTTLTKYALSVDNLPANDTHVANTGGASSTTGDGDRLAKTIVYVPKTTDISNGAKIKEAEKYLSESTSEEVIGKAITLDDVKFPNDDLIIKGESALFGDLNIARNASAGFGNGRRYCPVGFVDYINIPVEKKVASVHMKRDIAASLNWTDEDGNAVAVKNSNCAYIPVTIEGASENYYYFAKFGRLCNGEQAVFAVTVTGASLQDEIDALEARIDALDDTYNTAQKMEIAEIKNAIQSLEGKGVLEADYDAELIAKLDALYQSAEEEIKAAQIASVEGKITNMAFKYASSMRTEVEGIKAEYDALISSGILASEFNSDLMNKFSKVYDVYVMASGIEDKAEAWGAEYLYEMYDEVVAAKALADGLKENEAADADNVIEKATADKVSKFEKLAKDGLAIDIAIEGLDIIYNKDQLDTIIEIKKDIDEFKAAGGTDKGLANAEIFNALYEAAGPDLLQRDIDEVVARIHALDDIYTATADNEMASIEAVIKVIESKGGVVPSAATEKLASLVAQRDETPAYTPFDLPYNKDVMESVTRYVSQYKDANGNYVKDPETGRFVIQNPATEWTFAAFINGTSTCGEDAFLSKLGINPETNSAVIHGVPYQFGKVVTTVDGVIDKENNAISSSVATTVVIDVPNNSYAKIHAAMWAYKDKGKFSVTYKYADGTTSTEENVTVIAGGTSVSDTVKAPYYKVMTNDGKASLSLTRAYMPQYDTGSPSGGYAFAVTDHVLTPNDKKILDKIEIRFATTDAHLFAMTGQISNSVLLNKVLTETINKLDTISEENIRPVLAGCANLMSVLDFKEVAYNEEFKAIVKENKDKFVAIESIKSYTDLDNLTYTVKFTGPVAESSITKALFIIEEIFKNEEGKDVNIAFNDYEIIPVVENGEIREVKLVIKNKFEYDRRFTLTVDKNVAGISGKTIFTDGVAEYTAKPAVDTEFVLEENGTGSVKIVNNMNTAQEVTAIVAVYNEKNQMVAKYLVNKTLAAGEAVTQGVSFQLSEGQTVECLVLDSLTNCRKVYNTFVVK